MIFLYSKLDIQNKGEGLGNLQDFVEEPIVTWNASGFLEVEFKYFLHGDLAEYMIPDAKLRTRIHSNDEVYHLFTIYEVEPDYIENTIQVRAEMTLLHELKDRVVPADTMRGTANEMIMFVKNKMDRDYPFVITGSTDRTVFIEHDNISAYELIFGEDGILKRTGAEIGFTDRGIRVSNRIGTIHRDELRESDFVTNLTVNESQGEDFVTRIIPFTTVMFDRPIRDADRYTRETIETPTYGTPVISPNITNKMYKVRTKFVEYRNEPTEVPKYYNYQTDRGTETLEMNEYVYEDVTALNNDASTFFEDNIGIDEPTTTITIETLGLAKGYYTYLRYLNRYDIITIYVEPKPYLTNSSETYVVQVNETVYEPLSDTIVSIGFTNESLSLRDAYRNVNEGRISDQQLQAELQKERLRDLEDKLVNYVYNHDGFRLEFGNVLPPPDEYREGDLYYLETGEGIDIYKLVNGAWEFLVGQSTREIIEGKFEELQPLLDGLSDEIADNEATASDAVRKAEESLERIGTIDTEISDLRTDLNTVGGKAESSLEIIGIDGGAMYSKNRRLGSKSQPIQPDDRGLIQHNGEGFELGETYTISMKVSCIFDDVITWEDRSRTESIPFVRETQYRTDLLPEESFVERNGINGTATYTWQIELVNGEPTGNKTEEVRTNYKAPVNEIFIQGTKTKSNVILKFTVDDIIKPSPITKSNVVLNLIEPGGSVPTPPVDPAPTNFANARVVNLSDYGGNGDGVTDNFNAFKGVIDDSVNEPLVLQIDDGEYFVEGGTNSRLEPFPNKSKGLRIEGTGDNVNIYHKNNRTINRHEHYFMQLVMTEDSLGFEAENFTLDGIRNPQEELFYTQSESNPISNIPMARGISVDGAHHVNFNNVTFKNMYGGYAIQLQEYRDVSITNTTYDKVGGNDQQESFGMAIYLGGHDGDAVVEIDNAQAQGMVTDKDLKLSWIGVVLENGSIQSKNSSDWLRDKNTTVRITNSSFLDYHSTFHTESMAGNVYWNVDNVKARGSNYNIVAGVYGEFKEVSNRITMDVLPYGRLWGIVKGLYYSEPQEKEDNWNGHNKLEMYNSVINFIKVAGFEDPPQAVAYGNNVMGRLYNTQLNNVPNRLVTNGSALLYNSEVNLAQGNNATRTTLMAGAFSDTSKQKVEFTDTGINPYGSHKNVTFGTKPAEAKNNGFEAPWIELPITAPI